MDKFKINEVVHLPEYYIIEDSDEGTFYIDAIGIIRDTKTIVNTLYYIVQIDNYDCVQILPKNIEKLKTTTNR